MIAPGSGPLRHEWATGKRTTSCSMEQRSQFRIRKQAAQRGLIRGEGLLSVAIGLQPPTGSHSAVLQSTSDDPAKGLSVRFMDEKTRNLWTGFAAIATAVLGWWLRKAGFTTRLLYLLVTLLGPVSMRWLVPLAWLPLADGIWLGGVTTAVLWLIRCIVVEACNCSCMATVCKPNSSVTAPLIALALLGWASTAVAQEAAAKAAPAPMPATVFIPYDNVHEPLSAKNVFIPQELFLKLWRVAHPEDLPPTKPPVPATVSAAAFVVDLTALPANANGEGRRASTLCAGRAARAQEPDVSPGSSRVADQGHRNPFRDAGGCPAVLSTQDDKSLTVQLQKAGDSVLDLQFDVTVERTGPAGRIRWENSPLPAGLLTVKLPASDSPPELRVGGNKVSAAGPAEAGVISYAIAVDRGGAQDIAWQPATARSGDDSPIQVQAVTSVVVDDSGLRTRSEYTAKVSQKGVTELTLAFPGSMNLVRVEGRDIGGWRVEGEAAARKLIVYFARKIEAQTVFTVEAFQGVAIDERPQTLTVLPPQPEGVSREAGEIGVYVAPQLSTRPGTVVGLSQQDVTQFEKARPKATATPLQLAYRYAARPISLELVVQRRQVETRADLQHGVFLTQRKLRVSTRAVLHVAGAPRSSLTLALPPGYLLLDVTSPALADYSTTEGEAGRKVLTVEFDRPRTGDIELLLDGSIVRRPEEPSSIVMVPRLLDVNKIDSQLGVWIEDVYVATADALGDWKNADPNSLDEKLLRPAAGGDSVRLSQRLTRSAAGNRRASGPGSRALGRRPVADRRVERVRRLRLHNAVEDHTRSDGYVHVHDAGLASRPARLRGSRHSPGPLERRAGRPREVDDLSDGSCPRDLSADGRGLAPVPGGWPNPGSRDCFRKQRSRRSGDASGSSTAFCGDGQSLPTAAGTGGSRFRRIRSTRVRCPSRFPINWCVRQPTSFRSCPDARPRGWPAELVKRLHCRRRSPARSSRRSLKSMAPGGLRRPTRCGTAAASSSPWTCLRWAKCGCCRFW